jgi:hypothetical protein
MDTRRNAPWRFLGIPEGAVSVKIGFYLNDGKQHERDLARRFADGAATCGDNLVELSTSVRRPACDVVCIIGIKNYDLLREILSQEIPVIYIDKPYAPRRLGQYVRVAVNNHQPTTYLHDMEITESYRAEGFGWQPAPWRKLRRDVIFAGSSQKYCSMKELGSATQYAESVVDQIRRVDGRSRPIIYRPKPSWKDATPIPGTSFSREKFIGNVLEHAHVLVTYGSNACFEAMLCGVPSIILGNAVMRSISSTRVEDVNRPHYAQMSDRERLLTRLAHCQWSLDELSSGAAWSYLRRMLDVSSEEL